VTTQLISHYRILNKLGEGGMSEVYLAEDTKLNRKVAIKFLLPKLTATDRSRKRLVREAKAIASLDHPNICAIYEVNEDADKAFIVMQYVEGQSLATKIDSRIITLHEAIGIAVQIAAALREAHAHGIIHRDIKPQNIMVTTQGLVKVLDFGLAKAISNQQLVDMDGSTVSLISEPGTVVGTLAYFSPEQSRGEQLDERTDIFSFGIVLYEMITGRHPFSKGNPTSTLLAISTESPQPVSRYTADVSPEIERIVRKCLEKNPEHRYQSSRELCVDLEHLKRTTSSGTATLEADPTPRQLTFWQKRSAYQYVIAAAILFSIAGLLVYFAKGRTQSPINSVAVLPFYSINENRTNDDTRVLMSWISESIANSMQELPVLKKVIPPYSILALKKEGLSPQQVGQEYGVRAVLVGRFDQVGDEITIYINLIDTSDNHLIRGRPYRFSKSTGNTITQTICSEITEDLRLNLSPNEQIRLTQRETNNPDASIAYQKGREYWYKRHLQDVKTSIEYFKHALEIDPQYARAHTGLADAYAVLAESENPVENAALARGEAEKAISLDSNLAEAYTSLALVAFKFDWDWQKVEANFDRSIKLKPNSPDAYYWYASYLMAMGRGDESVAQVQRAAELDPLNQTYRIHVARVLYLAGRLDEAIANCKRAIAMNPNSAVAHYVMGQILTRQGAYDHAIDEFQHALSLTEDKPFLKAVIAVCYAKQGKKDDARVILNELEREAKEGHVAPLNLAFIKIALGDKENAFESLEKAYQQRANLLAYLKVDPYYDPIRSDQRFKDLLRRVGLAE
jgi:serine/threonine protein kinase/Tfp pilus assembly protein PilF